MLPFDLAELLTLPREAYIALGLFGAAGALHLAGSRAGGASGGKKEFGDARFASAWEIQRAGLFGREGIIVGEHRDMLGRKRLLRLPPKKYPHAGVVAETRSGKGVSIVMPNLLDHSGSVVAFDLKGELRDQTMGFRKNRQPCYVWAPFAPPGVEFRTHRFSFLGCAPSDPARRVTFLQRMAHALVPDETRAKSGKIWTANGRALFLGIALYLFETPGEPRTFSRILYYLQHPEGCFDFFKRVLETRGRNGTAPLSLVCAQALATYVHAKAEETRTGFHAEVMGALEPWLNPQLCAATDGDDFDLRTLRTRPQTIYICVGSPDLALMAPVVALFLSLVVELNSEVERAAEYRHRVLVVPDELASLPPIEAILDGIARIGSFDLQLLPAFQSKAQLREKVGPHRAETFLANMLQIVFTTSQMNEAKKLSEQLGPTTIKARTKTVGKGQASVSEAEHARPLMLPTEIMQMGDKMGLLFLPGRRPIRFRRIFSYADARFKARSGWAFTPVPLQHAEMPDYLPPDPADESAAVELSEADMQMLAERVRQRAMGEATAAPAAAPPSAGRGRRGAKGKAPAKSKTEAAAAAAAPAAPMPPENACDPGPWDDGPGAAIPAEVSAKAGQLMKMLNDEMDSLK